MQQKMRDTNSSYSMPLPKFSSSVRQDFKPSECKIIIHDEPRRYKKHEMQINLLAGNEHQ
jgi:hypothetical protein